MSHLTLEHFYQTTATNAWDLADGKMRPNAVTVGYCPVELGRDKPSLINDKLLPEQKEYIDKAIQFITEQLAELEIFIDTAVDEVIHVAVASILAGWNDIMDKGHTVGVMLEGTLAVGLGVVGGVFFAFDKTGRSIIGFAGLAAGAVAEAAIIFGGFFYPGSRQGLEGWGGEFNASAAFIVGLEWEAMFTGGKTGHVAAATFGTGVALSVEFQYAWLIDERES